ncbi:restriction endonuclease subunit S [Vibrio vulnificus]|nr:restriction endonuclease subunit S [Vibrio vulnificus]
MAIFATVNFSEFEFKNRIDAELYREDLKSSFSILEKSGFPIEKISNHFLIRSGTTPSDRVEGLTEGAVLFKTTDIRNNVITTSGDFYRISEKIHSRMSKTKLQKSDVLLNIVGATLGVIGRCAYVENVSDAGANITQAMVLLRAKSKKLMPGFIFAYLNTKYAQDQIARYARPTGQYNLNLREVGYISAPIVPMEIQLKIQEAIEEVYQKKELYLSLYIQAQELLEKELGLDTLVFPARLYSESSFLSVINDHRLDAQHYQHKFNILIDHLQKFPVQTIRRIRTLNRRGLQPKYIENGDFPVVNSQHITNIHLAYDNFERTSELEFLRAKEAHIIKDDVLTYTTGAYIGQTNLYDSEIPAMASNHVNILRVKGVDSGYLSIVLQSVIGKLQTEKYSRGSAQAELYPSDIDKFIVPIIDAVKQKEIGDLLRKSLKAKKESEQILDQAKIMVEELIEGAIQ